MLKRRNNLVFCPTCDRSWHMMDGLKQGDACPSDDCASNALTPIGIVLAVCKDFDDDSIESRGCTGALLAMNAFWKKQPATNPLTINEALTEMMSRLDIMRSEILNRLTQE